MIQTLDLFATIRGITGGTDPATDPLARPSVNMKPFLLNPLAGNIHTTLYSESPTSCAMRDGQFKIVLNKEPNPMGINACSSTLPNVCHFYDVESDPLEITDLMTAPLSTFQHDQLAYLKAALRTLRGWASGPVCTELP